MNIAVYCGSNSGNKDIYTKDAKALGEWIGKNGHSLVYGGAKNGLMGVVADAVIENGGEVIGILPNVPLIQERKQAGLTKYIETDTMAERKTLMIENSDAFVALPGGLGTLDELSEVMTLSYLKEVKGPIVIYNTDGYYEPLKIVFDKMCESGFAAESYFENVIISNDLGEIEKFVNKNQK
ncbi:MAG: TIGR00730 family Rossman fold protein [Lachnospiraceae bacterium]|nr:TIGR00730 family Rossman fold protein [Lachnospiraceae bacterium]